ncbi:MAG: guanylate kinase [Clostridia bacterium]|nr:guanylate kinase [Clostridia bacterium]MDR3643836.1 guanylate kinase [Clostridia bacterium]
MSEPGLLIVISGPSGAGKDSVLLQLAKRRGGLFYSVSATTREPRAGEAGGQDYYFLTDEEFERLIAQGKLLEYTEYNGKYYGTPRQAVEERLARGEDVILVIEVRGAMQVKKSFPEAVLVFILPPSMQVLEKRLRGRGTETEAQISGRLAIARGEIGSAVNYDYVVINDALETAAAEIDAIVCTEKLKASRNRKRIQEVLDHA